MPSRNANSATATLAEVSEYQPNLQPAVREHINRMVDPQNGPASQENEPKIVLAQLLDRLNATENERRAVTFSRLFKTGPTISKRLRSHSRGFRQGMVSATLNADAE